MKILVIGGSYFLGRAFTLIASKEHELTLINRGTYSMARYGIKEYKADRRDEKALQSIPPDNYDAMEVLSQVSEVPIKLATISTKEALKEYAEGTIYLPFPVTKEEDERYEGSKAERELNIQVY